jgi:hypothetical protein
MGPPIFARVTGDVRAIGADGTPGVAQQARPAEAPRPRVRRR